MIGGWADCLSDLPAGIEAPVAVVASAWLISSHASGEDDAVGVLGAPDGVGAF
jgi:hypothetical protein